MFAIIVVAETCYIVYFPEHKECVSAINC
jgi:predicted RNase H-like HicB family nuclease